MPDDLHDRGLALDLATMRVRLRSRPVGRRHALKLLAGAGAGAVLVACSSDSGGSASTSSSTTTTAAGAGTTSSTTGGSVDAIPEENGGPYPGDGSNGPNVLVEDGIMRQEIRSSFGAMSGTAAGIPLRIALQVVDAASGTPREEAALHLWHCTAEGGYSLYAQGISDQNFLRGVQVADTGGNLSFTSIYPGAYEGRWPHIHVEVFDDVDTATSGGSPIVTSQIALPAGASREAYLTDGYGDSRENLASSSLESDMVFSDGHDRQLATVDGDPTAGYTASLVVGV